MGEYTLDIPEVQVLVNFPLDGDGFYWHHRILLHRITGGTWLALTPDHEVVRHDLTVTPHRVLDRRALYPEDIADEVYAHDVIGRATLTAFKRQAKVQAAILGEGDIDDTESSEWLISEPSHPLFGEKVEERLLNNEATGLTFNTKGVVVLDGEETFIERVLSKDVEDWRKKKGLEQADIRLLGDHKDAGGKRHLDLLSAVGLMKEPESEADFPIAGVRAARELHDSIARGPGNFVTYHAEWLRQSGVGKKASAAHIHRSLCESLRLMHSWDQIDSSSTAIGEHLSRWLIQTEVAVDRNPAQPDYTGLDIISGTSITAEGRAATSKFTEWLGARLKERAGVWKQERLYAQERRMQKGKGGGKGGEDSSDGDNAGIRKKKKKKAKSSGGGDKPPASSA